jgi:hypothetical protein
VAEQDPAHMPVTRYSIVTRLVLIAAIWVYAAFTWPRMVLAAGIFTAALLPGLIWRVVILRRAAGQKHDPS